MVPKFLRSEKKKLTMTSCCYDTLAKRKMFSDHLHYFGPCRVKICSENMIRPFALSATGKSSKLKVNYCLCDDEHAFFSNNL